MKWLVTGAAGNICTAQILPYCHSGQLCKWLTAAAYGDNSRSGVNKYPDCKHNIITLRGTGAGQSAQYQVSLHAPKNHPAGADIVASHFSGGGRKGVAGIDAISLLGLEKPWQAANESRACEQNLKAVLG